MMGRITQSMMSNQMLQNLNNNLSAMSHYQQQTGTAKKINKPSDDPVGINYTLRYKADIGSNDQYQENVDSAISWMDSTDTLLSQAGDVIQRIRELSVQGANGSNQTTAMNAIKSEVDQLTNQLVTIGNTQFNGKYVFNGQITDVAPYQTGVTKEPLSAKLQGVVDVSTANVTISNNKLSLKIDQNKEISVTLPPKDYTVGGAAAFSTDLQLAINQASPSAQVNVTVTANNELVIASNNTGVTGGVEITGGSLGTNWLSANRTMSDLVKTPNPLSTATVTYTNAQFSDSDTRDVYFEISTGLRMPINVVGNDIFGKAGDDDNLFKVLNEISNALGQNDSASISNLLGKLDSRMNTFLEVRADVGAKMNRIQLTDERIKDSDLNLKTLLSKTEDVDVAELIMKLKSYENVYQASLSVGAKVIKPTLVDYLR